METVVCVTSVTAAGYIISTMTKELKEIPDGEIKPRVKVTQLMISLLGIVLWPMIFVLILNTEWNSGIMTNCLSMWLAFLWVIILFMIDIYVTASAPSYNIESAQEQQKEVKNTFLAVVSTVFAFGVLLGNIAKNGGRSARSSQICITGLILGLAFAIPSFDTSGDDYHTYLSMSVTKTVCLWAVGIFMSGIVLEMHQLSQVQKTVQSSVQSSGISN